MPKSYYRREPGSNTLPAPGSLPLSVSSRRRTKNQLLSGRRGGQRFLLSTMAGVARYVCFPVRELGIDVLDHGEHHAGRELLRLLVARPVLHVAEPAHHAQALRRSAHSRYEVSV